MLKDGALREGVSDSTSHAHAMLPAWGPVRGCEGVLCIKGKR